MLRSQPGSFDPTLTYPLLADPETLRLGRLCVHVLLWRSILHTALLPSNLLPKHPQHQPDRIWSQDARAHYPSHHRRHRTRLCADQGWDRPLVLARWRCLGDSGCRPILHHGCQYPSGQVDWLPDTGGLHDWLDFPGRDRQCANPRPA